MIDGAQQVSFAGSWTGRHLSEIRCPSAGPRTNFEGIYDWASELLLLGFVTNGAVLFCGDNGFCLYTKIFQDLHMVGE